MSNDEMHRCALGTGSRPLTELIAVHRLRWLGCALHMPVHRLLFRVLFARVDQAWKKRRGDHITTWRRDMKKLVSVLASIGVPRRRGLGPRDEDCC